MGLAVRKVIAGPDLLLRYSVEDLLVQWGCWGCSGVGTGSLSTPIYDNSHWIDDSIGLWLDRAVAQLAINDDHKKLSGYKICDRKRAIFLYYRERYNLPMLANALKLGQPKATIVLRSAESWVEGYLTLNNNI